MSIHHRFHRLLALAAILSVPATMATAQSFDAERTAQNKALAEAPRSLEAYPWLTARAGKTSGTVRDDRNSARFAAVKNHRGLSAAPRMIEEYPQLAFQNGQVRNTPKSSDSPAFLRNQAIAASPRMIEQFPALALPPITTPKTPAYEIAPLK